MKGFLQQQTCSKHFNFQNVSSLTLSPQKLIDSVNETKKICIFKSHTVVAIIKSQTLILFMLTKQKTLFISRRISVIQCILLPLGDFLRILLSCEVLKNWKLIWEMKWLFFFCKISQKFFKASLFFSMLIELLLLKIWQMMFFHVANF